jgi:hypothetical protein
MNLRENTLRAARFESPERIPADFVVGPHCWVAYPRDALQELMAGHPLLFPNFEKSSETSVPAYAPWRRAGQPYTDSWGCVWETAENGITGAVVKHPLADWSAFDAYSPPSPHEQDGWGPIDWDRKRARIAVARQEGRLAMGELRHGHTFLTLTYLRGYENFIFDMCDDPPQLGELIAMVEAFNRGLVRRYVEAGVEWMGYPEDLGMQRGPMLSPDQFRRYIKPSYQRLIAPAREAGCVIHMHSDGDIRELADDLLDIGIDVLNLQDVVNGIDWTAANLKGRACIDLDIDRQSITRFGTPQQIDDHIRRAVVMLGSKEGGLMLKYGLYRGVPLENAKAVMDAMEKYSLHFS